MKIQWQIIRRMFLVALVAVGAGLASPSSTYAASISFVPAGAQLDGDPILDIETAIGANIDFTIMLNTAGLGGPIDLVFNVSWDGPNMDLPGDIGELINTSIFFAPGPFGGADSSVQTGDLETVTYSNIPANVVGALTVFNFTVGPNLVNDGFPDFGLGLVSATCAACGGDVSGLFGNLPQIVEVQPAIPEPSTALLLGLGLIGLATRQRKSTFR